MCVRCWPSAERVAAGRSPLFQVAHIGRLGDPHRREPDHCQELLKAAAAAKIILEVEIRCGRAGRTASKAEINRLYLAGGFQGRPSTRSARGARKYLLAATFGNDARRVQARQRGAQARGACRGAAGGCGEARIAQWCTKAFRFRLPWRLGLMKSEIERGFAQVRRGEDERRHRHPVPRSPAPWRHRVHQLAGCSRLTARWATRRRTTAQLPQEGRGLDVRARGRGLQRPAQRGPGVTAGWSARAVEPELVCQLPPENGTQAQIRRELNQPPVTQEPTAGLA